ncbi:MAG TPA: phospholipid-binding protein, partial [Chromatiales bacterium]|nr:phospholipid-binding protein [Chromatiales bacterium]
MKLSTTSFIDNGPIPERCAFGVPGPEQHMRLGQNRNPQLQWSELPAGTRSLVLLCVDPDVPTVGDDVNQEGRHIP